MKSLKFSLGDKRKSPTVVIRIGITLENFHKLKFDYDLTGSFKAKRRFKNDYIIYQKRFFFRRQNKFDQVHNFPERLRI